MDAGDDGCDVAVVGCGIAGRGAPIALSFLEPGRAVTGRLLPTGHARDVLAVPDGGPIEATLIDAATAPVVVRAHPRHHRGGRGPLRRGRPRQRRRRPLHR